MSPFWIIIFITKITFIFSILASVNSQPFDYPTGHLSATWTNRPDLNAANFSTIGVRLILLRGTVGPKYACGFYCNGTCHTFQFSIFIVHTDGDGEILFNFSEYPQVVWSANRNIPVGENATVQLTSEGDLVLRDADGTLTWSTNTAGRDVAGLNLTEMGNLVLFDSNNSTVWQSFDHPTDCLVPGQILLSGMNLTASGSPTNWSQRGVFSVSMTQQGLVASVLSDPPQIYLDSLFRSNDPDNEASYATFENGSLSLYQNSTHPVELPIRIPIPQATSAQYMKLGPDGHLRVFEWGDSWKEVADILTSDYDECSYPMVCGKYGICSNGQCRCPGSSFRPINDRDPSLGCDELIPLTCNDSDNHSFLDLVDVTYFSFNYDIVNTDMSSCKEACLKNCSCKAAVFQSGIDSATGGCYLPPEIFSLMNKGNTLTRFNSSVSIKVQIDPIVTPPAKETTPAAARGKTNLLWPILGSTLGVFSVAAVVGTTVIVYWKKRRRSEQVEEDYLDNLPGIPTRFSVEELSKATDNFNKKLGEGGFGSVYEGSLNDGTRIAVKRLSGVGHIKKSFLAEVESIGSIHHINLVRLIGFCADKSHMLLVYEYMCNGSLDKWIYCRTRGASLDWNNRRKIIRDIAKGLAYLHEDCRQKIIHLDIKPQNILLDEHYNAKLADFGLSKLIDRNQSQVVTTMRGTPGYLAPEWLSAVITEKVDVYSFGVVILEILSGRKIFEQSKPEEERYLLTLFKQKAEEGQWLDLVDRCCLNVELNVGEVMEMLQMAAWCLQSDHEKRPSISTVIKVLEGVKNVPKDIDYNFVVPQYLISKIPQVKSQEVTALLPSVLSGPR